MPKEECKLSSGCKHKERKPKKPHYIPRPFGKPYNYKCFQCPFTCMEKSHLYNHMKYSLCKNSLSLLIDSDWPYKKGNLLPSEPRRLQQGIVGNHEQEQEQEEQTGGDDLQLSFTEKQELEMETGADAQAETNLAANQSSESSQRGGAKQEAELIMADMFSLEEQLLRARSVEVESKLRHYRLSKTRLLLSDSLPCYPSTLPAGHHNSPDAPPVNLSLLGVGYPLTSDLFSYLNPSLSTASASNPAQTGPLPFLSSAAQLTHTHTHSDRSVLTPRIYYPFLCEHAPADASKAVKPTAFTPKLNLWKFPTLRPAVPTEAWSSPGSSSPETGSGSGDRVQGRWGMEQSGKRAAASQDSHNAPAEKKAAPSFLLNQTMPISVDRLLLQSSLSSRAGLDERHWNRGNPAHFSEMVEKDRETDGEMDRGTDGEMACDLTSALQELRRAEREAELHRQHAHSHHMWAQKIRKIRLELSHIQQALQRAAQGPLDLSIKREPIAMTTTALGGKQHPGQRQALTPETRGEEEIETEDEWKKRSLDFLFRMGQSQGVSMVTPVVKTEPFLSDAETLWNSRTRKCEADSSVRVCSKTQNCPSSPITASAVQ